MSRRCERSRAKGLITSAAGRWAAWSPSRWPDSSAEAGQGGRDARPARYRGAPGRRAVRAPDRPRRSWPGLGQRGRDHRGGRSRGPSTEDSAADAELVGRLRDRPGFGAFGGDLDADDPTDFRDLDAEGRRDLVFRHFQIDRVYTEEVGPERRKARLWKPSSAPGSWPGPAIEPQAHRGRASSSSSGRPTGQVGPAGLDGAEHWAGRPGRSAAWISAHSIPGDHAGILRAPGGRQASRRSLKAEIARRGGDRPMSVLRLDHPPVEGPGHPADHWSPAWPAAGLRRRGHRPGPARRLGRGPGGRQGAGLAIPFASLCLLVGG